jgi:hypothetical protein
MHKLPEVHVFVTGLAGRVQRLKEDALVSRSDLNGLVALVTSNLLVFPTQRES